MPEIPTQEQLLSIPSMFWR